MIEKIQTLISKQNIDEKIAEIASMIEKDYEHKDIHFVCVLKGGVVFTVDLARQINKNVYLHFMDVSSYGEDTKSSGDIKILMDLDESIKDKHVIIVEDIIDSGMTLNMLKKRLLGRNPASLKICALLNKECKKTDNIDIDYLGFNIPDEFVVGYGLDYAQKYRNLNYIGIISFEEE